MRFVLASVLSAALLCGCTSDGDASEAFTEKTCVNSVDCCFSDDDCAEGEYCEGEGACDSEGTCERISRLPCGLAFDPETGEPTMQVCGCDGTTYQGACMATTSGHRIASAGVCEGAMCFSNEECPEGEYCAGEGGCDSEGTCRKRMSTPCGVILDPETGLVAEPMLCGCDGNTYLTLCNVGNAGTRVDPSGTCAQEDPL